MLMILGMSGCTVPAWSPPPPPEMIPIVQTEVVYPNPVFIPIPDSQCAWEAVADVIDDYFKIEKELPMRQIGAGTDRGRVDEGVIETCWQVSPTLLEPWRRDTAGEYERVENTLQTMRRRAVVHVRPGEGGHWVDVAVFKELEDLRTPEYASAGSATFRYDSSFTRVINPSAGAQDSQCWIYKGRDPVLEQRIIGHLIYNSGELGYSMQTNGSGFRIQGSEFGIQGAR